MTEANPIRETCQQRGITRLCHVTQARNLPHILTERRLLSARDLNESDLPSNPNDHDRLDGHDDFISCTIEYPNVWFLKQVAARELLFQDWIVLEIAPRLPVAAWIAIQPCQRCERRRGIHRRGCCHIRNGVPPSPGWLSLHAQPHPP
jgi:hypothetical protein